VHAVSEICIHIQRIFAHVHIFTQDPFIDDNVEFARRLRYLNVQHHMIVVDHWPHGFLDFGLAAVDIAQYNQEIIVLLKTIVQSVQQTNNNNNDTIQAN
jgi:acetyl esterase/lipase